MKTMMKKLFAVRPLVALEIYVFLDIICIGMGILMIVISPGLQLLTTLFASHLTPLAWLNGENRTPGS